ncbi:uncharacterized protein [Dermacentor albipictus]|uniref:uncharacterized protein isoform X1 n=1 Tax=Dermacentor albipictus TaxID=60249 RepID=UPI0038FCF0A4
MIIKALNKNTEGCDIFAALTTNRRIPHSQEMTAVLARADPEEVGGNVVEALRLLEHLDKYYSHVNRPRFGRSVPVRFSGGSMSSTSDEYER